MTIIHPSSGPIEVVLIDLAAQPWTKSDIISIGGDVSFDNVRADVSDIQKILNDWSVPDPIKLHEGDDHFIIASRKSHERFPSLWKIEGATKTFSGLGMVLRIVEGQALSALLTPSEIRTRIKKI